MNSRPDDDLVELVEEIWSEVSDQSMEEVVELLRAIKVNWQVDPGDENVRKE